MGWFGALFEGGKNKQETSVEKKIATPASVTPEKRMAAIRDVARAGKEDVQQRQAKAQEIAGFLQNRGIKTNRLETIASQGKEFNDFFSASGTQFDTESHFSNSETTKEIKVEPVVEKILPPSKPTLESSERGPVINGPEKPLAGRIEGLVAAHDDEVEGVISLDQKRAEKQSRDNEDPIKLREIAKVRTREIIDKEMTLRELSKKGENPLTKKLGEEIKVLREANSALFQKIVGLERAQKNEQASLDKAA